MKFFAHIAVLSVFVLTAGVAEAQRTRFSSEQMRERQESFNAELIEQLDLSDDQTLKVDEILAAALDARIEMIAEMRSGGRRRQGIREEMVAITDDTEEKLSEVLTDDQLEAYKKIRAERPRRDRSSGSGSGRSS
ncbi:MAG: hypothetical protein BMS9Abin05_1549 [Rhodothermia bacterium]|nr:MAG: hypothetical protein BMS9Abin05_1549 [Rhodothermia bacterium]